MNEVKGTRMPDYSKVSRERDFYGELGWIPNFNVKCSKDNNYKYTTNREYFDGPINYHNTFNNSTMTNSEFFRSKAPSHSVAKENVQTLAIQRNQVNSTLRNTATTFSTSVYATPYILERDYTNKYKVDKSLEKTQDF